MEKKFTLITGASSGLGKELAKFYAKDKNNLLLVARNLDSLNKLKEEIEALYKVEVDVLSKDLSNLNEVKEIKDYVLEKGYFINNLVNNAGFGDTKDFVNMDIDFNIKLNEVNINALMYLTHFVLKDMLKNDEGHIINVASVAGFLPSPHMSTYHASKAYVIYLTEAISEEIKKSNPVPACICSPFVGVFRRDTDHSKKCKRIGERTQPRIRLGQCREKEYDRRARGRGQRELYVRIPDGSVGPGRDRRIRLRAARAADPGDLLHTEDGIQDTVAEAGAL